MKISNKIILGLSSAIIGIAADELIIGKMLRKDLDKKDDELMKFREFYQILLQWIRVYQEGRTLVNYFRKNNFKTVAIYGMRELGEALLDDLRGSEIQVKYGVDKSADSLYVDIDMYSPDDEMEDVDVLVVTAVHYFVDIEDVMRKKISGKIVSIEDVVWEA